MAPSGFFSRRGQETSGQMFSLDRSQKAENPARTVSLSTSSCISAIGIINSTWWKRKKFIYKRSKKKKKALQINLVKYIETLVEAFETRHTNATLQWLCRKEVKYCRLIYRFSKIRQNHDVVFGVLSLFSVHFFVFIVFFTSRYSDIKALVLCSLKLTLSSVLPFFFFKNK